MKYIIGNELKKARKNAKMTVEDVVAFLGENDIYVSTKTVYGWENDFAYPSVHIFLLLCEKYGITDVIGTFLHTEEIE